MTGPMILLAVGSVAAGGALLLGGRLVRFLEPVVGETEGLHGFVTPLSAVTLATVLVGVAIAYAQYQRREVPATQPAGGPATVAARRELYGDAFNETVFMRPGQYLTRLLVFVENRGLDGVVSGVAALVTGASGRVRRWQTGFVRSYALSMFVGAAIVVAAMLVVRL